MTPEEHVERAERLWPWVSACGRLADQATRIPTGVGYVIAVRIHSLHVLLHRRWHGHIKAASAGAIARLQWEANEHEGET